MTLICTTLTIISLTLVTYNIPVHALGQQTPVAHLAVGFSDSCLNIICGRIKRPDRQKQITVNSLFKT